MREHQRTLHREGTEKQRESSLQRPSKGSISTNAITQSNAAMVVHHRPRVTSTDIHRNSLLQLQRTHGNLYVQRVLLSTEDGTRYAGEEVEISGAVGLSRSYGQPLDRAVGIQLGRSLNAQFPRVGVRTDSGAGKHQLVQQAEEAATTTEAIAVAPEGPLAQLRDELDDVFVNESFCLQQIDQLGAGERELVRGDRTLMQQMADAFNASEMLRAVDALDCPPKWAIYWLGRAGVASDIGDAGYERLLANAQGTEVAEIFGWAEVRRIFTANYGGSPLGLSTLVDNPARTRHVIGAFSEFSDWVISSAGADVYLHYIATHDPRPCLGSLRAAGKVNALLSALRSLGVTDAHGSDLLELFRASNSADERARIFETRFGERVSGEFDWMADGEAHWNQRLQISGEGQTEAAIAAGIGTTTTADTASADPEGPLARLRDELDDVFVDEGECLENLRALNARERFLVRGDQQMMRQMAEAFDASEMMRALRMLAFTDVKWAVYWLDVANAADDVGPEGFQALLAPATGQAIANLIGWRRAFNVVKEHSGLDALGIAPLANDGARMAWALGQAAYVDWTLERPGAQGLVRYLHLHSPAQTGPAAMETAGRINQILAGLPTGSALAPDDRRALFELHKHLQIANARKLFAKRFNVTVGTQTGGAAFEGQGLQRTWQLLDRLPESAIASNEWLEAINRRDNPSAPTPQGVVGAGGQSSLALGYGAANLGASDTGEFTDPGDVLRNQNLFDAVAIHEAGHVADRTGNFSGDDGPLATRNDLGAWRLYRNSSEAAAETLLDDMLALAPLPPALTAAQQTNAKAGFVKALRQQNQNAQQGFQDLGSAAGEPWAAGQSWFDLWQLVQGHALVAVLQDGHLTNSTWNNPPASTLLSGRYFHQAYSNRWSSYLAAVRGGQKLSRYQFRTRGEFFGEIYAVFYMSTPPGVTLRAWNRTVYDWFVRDVDRGHSTRVRP